MRAPIAVIAREVVVIPAPAAAPTRRAVLAGLLGAGLAALLAACTGTANPTAAPSGLPAPASPPAPLAPPATTVPGGQVTPAATPTRAAIATASKGVGTAAATPAGAAPQLVVTPTTALLDAPVTIRLTGLAPGQEATLRARSDVGAQLRNATATFRADATGTIDPAAQAPESGTYGGIDPDGLLWSGIDPYAAVGVAGTPTAAQVGPIAYASGTAPIPVTIDATVAGRALGRATLTRQVVAPGVARRAVGDGGLAGTLFTPADPGPHPGVVVLGGSEGGISGEQRAALLAAHGFAALALAYFAYGSLPPQLVDVPLEYLGTALDYLAAQPGVRGAQLGVVGHSRGAELALLMGATFPRVGAVVALAPSAYVWGGLGDATGGPEPAAWTYQGRPLPFVPFRATPASHEAALASARAGRGLADTPIFLSSLALAAQEDPATLAAAAIPVERTAGPILTVAGEADQLWPSGTFAGLIGDRLAQHGHAHPDATLRYPDAGHFFQPPNLPTAGAFIEAPRQQAPLATGGTTAGNAAAATDSWPRVLRFLADALGS